MSGTKMEIDSAWLHKTTFASFMHWFARYGSNIRVVTVQCTPPRSSFMASNEALQLDLLFWSFALHATHLQHLTLIGPGVGWQDFAGISLPKLESLHIKNWCGIAFAV